MLLNWLKRFVVEIAGMLGMTTLTKQQEYWQFLIQVLEGIIESNGNSQVVYPLLQANLDKLDDGFTQIVQAWAKKTLAKVEPQGAPLIAAILGSLGNLMREFPLGNKASNLETAIACYQNALKVYTRVAMQVKWAMTQNNLANVYKNRILGDQANNIEDAIACYQNALEVYTRVAMPVEWATTQNSLANVYNYRILGDRANNIEDAIACYQNAQQFANAYKSLAEAIATVESLRGEIISGSGIEGNKQKLAEEWYQLYSSMVEVCLELDKPTEAIEYVERSKGRNLVELLANKDLYPKTDSYPNQEVYQTHCQQLDKLRREIPVRQRELEIFTRNRESEKKYGKNIKTQQQKLNYLKQQQDDLLEEINQLDSSFRFTQQVEPILFSDIQDLIDDHNAIIEWYITGDQILTFVITRQNQQPQVKQSSSEDLQALIDLTSEHLTNYYNKKDQWRTYLDELISRLAQTLHIDKILSELPQECKQLILIPHSWLHLFPLHALPIDKTRVLHLGDTALRAVMRYTKGESIL